MEIVISLILGAWIAASGWICYRYYKNDDKREKER